MPNTDSISKRRLRNSKRTVKDLTHRHFNHWLVLRFAGMGKHRQSHWLCRCDCGTKHIVSRSDLLTGHSKSCGCFQRNAFAVMSITHGLSNTRVWRIYIEMHRRCYDPRRPAYSDYGGRGIKVCEGWHSLELFVSDMGMPSDDHSIDRIDNDGNYSCGRCAECIENEWPMNCQWATTIQQARNRRNNRLITYDGQTFTLSEWEETTGINQSQIWRRLDRGWPIEEALGFKEHLSRQGQRPARTGYKSENKS